MNLNFISSDQYRPQMTDLRDIMDMNICIKTGIDGSNILFVKQWQVLMMIVKVEGWSQLTEDDAMKAD